MRKLEIAPQPAPEFKEEEQKYPFLISDNVNHILRGIDAAVRKNSWVYISGDVGTGKSEIRKYQYGRWQRDPKNYSVVSLTAWLRPGSRVSLLMKALIAAISPDTHIPGDIELRAERLKTLLMQAHRAGRKVIIMIDEAQDLSDQTFRELKKVHEITAFGVDHLFSIVMFAKESLKADGLLAGRELGYRVKRLPILPLSDHEMCEFAEKRFELKFPAGVEGRRIRSYFTQMAHPSPLGVRHLCEAIADTEEYKGELTMNIIQIAMKRDLVTQAKKYRITLKEHQAAIKEQFGVNVAESTLSEIRKGNTERYSDKTVAMADQVLRDMLNKAKAEERRAM